MTVRIVRQIAERIAALSTRQAASIPRALSLDHAKSPRRTGERILMTAAGAGLAGGAVLLRV
jgi:3-oxoacyl-[acyl-carrier-protein] synthase-3